MPVPFYDVRLRATLGQNARRGLGMFWHYVAGVAYVVTLPLPFIGAWYGLKRTPLPISPFVSVLWLIYPAVCMLFFYIGYRREEFPLFSLSVSNVAFSLATTSIWWIATLLNFAQAKLLALPSVQKHQEVQAALLNEVPPQEPSAPSTTPLLERIIRRQLNQGRVISDALKENIQWVITAIDSADTATRNTTPPTETPSPELIAEFSEAAYLEMFGAYFQHFPKVSDPTFFEAPVTSVLPVGQVVSNMLKATVWGERKYGCFQSLYRTIDNHAWGVTRQFLSEKEIASGKKIWPNTYPGNPADIPTAYLRDTPLFQLFQYQTLPIALPVRLRLEHMFVLAPSGTGKTQLIQTMIARDLEQVAAGEASIVIIDSQGVNRRKTNAPTLVENLINLQLFATDLRGKLTYIKPSATLSCNLLDMGQNDPGLSDEQQMVRRTSAREIVSTALGGGSDLQFQMLQWCLRLVMLADAPTIRTLRRILAVDDAKKFAEEFKGLLAKADDLTREYFQHLHRGARNTTREALISRIDGLFTEDTFREMLSKPTNDFRIIDEIEAGKVVVVDADKSLLGEYGAEAFGRFFLAQLLYASRQRQSTKPVYVYIDECHDFVSDDENVSKLLLQARKQDIGLILATQNLTNIHSPAVRENLQGVAITVTHNEEKRGVMNLKMRGRAQPIEFKLDYGVMERMPRMTDEQYAEVHRPKAPPPPQLIPQPLKPATNDDDVIH